MPRGRLIFDGDNVYTEKQKRIHKLTPAVEVKIDNIPGVVDDATSISSTDALSARMGKVLQDQINELKSMWRFLSTWDCVNGLPTTDPLDNPYDYRIGDYYIVSAVSQSTNYRPMWATYIHWQASTAVETETVKINDWYLYDGTHWILQSQSQVTIVIDSELSTTSTNAVENRVVTTALNTKQNTISDLATIRSGAAAGATALQPWANISELTNNSWFQTAWDVASAIAGKANVADLATVATSWDFNDLINIPTQTVVNNSTITISKNGTTVDSFTTNAASAKTIDISIPTKTSDLNNDSWYITSASLPTKTSDLNNDSWFITSSAVWNWMVTITQWGSNKWSFTLNQNTAVPVTLDAWFIPTNSWAVWQVLMKTANGYAWANVDSWWNVIALTQAEYNALPEATKADWKLRIISDAPSIEVWGLTMASDSPLKPKYVWNGTLAQFNALWSHSIDTYYVIIDN